MIGAGIFVFPGLAAGQAGAAATGSFALGGVVTLLLSILAVVLGWGSLGALGLLGRPSAPEQFLPFGPLSVLTTAALVFTSYLGFAQVATVAGEMRRPGRNLPLTMVGSVVIVGTLCVVTVFVATSAFGSSRLAHLGETAMVDVGRHYLGELGALAVVFGDLLATMSSANASILSTSRAVYAVSKDALLPGWASRINLRYGTPHVALGLADGPCWCWWRRGRSRCSRRWRRSCISCCTD
jgi:amino acid transporter